MQYEFRRCQAKLVVNKRSSLTRVVVQEGNYCNNATNAVVILLFTVLE